MTHRTWKFPGIRLLQLRWSHIDVVIMHLPSNRLRVYVCLNFKPRFATSFNDDADRLPPQDHMRRLLQEKTHIGEEGNLKVA